MGMPNLLATKPGRLAAFFFLYMTEGIPLGFAATAVATQLRRQGIGPAEIGVFVGTFYLPWAFKWAFGPIVDVFYFERFGRRRGWIILTQFLMAVTLLSTVLVRLPDQLWLFTLILLAHNTFGATQDVAIDALACNTLRDDERGIANGMMFAGAYVGQGLGGAGVLKLTGYTGFTSTFFFVAGAILLVTTFIVLPMKEAAGAPRIAAAGSRLRAAGREMHAFAVDSFRSFLGSRGAFSGLFFALFPAGAMCLGLSLQSNLAVELGMTDDQVANLNFWSAVISAVACVSGGFLSDRLGRRKTLFTYIALMGLPVLYMMNMLTHYGWIMPVDVTAVNRPEVPAGLVTAFWIASLVYAVINGLMYGTRSAIFMDVTNPAVAATQFTAYMALMNLTIAYSSTWQGIAVEAWGYPLTMLVDAIFGLCCLAFIPLMKRPAAGAAFTDSAAPLRARAVGFGLALLCFAYVPYRMWHDTVGAAQPIAGTLFTLIFVGSALFLLAGGAVLGDSARTLSRIGAWIAPLLLLMHARYYLDTIGGWFGYAQDSPELAGFMNGADLAMRLIPVAAGVVLLLLALQPWRELHAQPGLEPAETAA
jgi:PAT family beta-lactamase induction signal transducer AmpG